MSKLTGTSPNKQLSPSRSESDLQKLLDDEVQGHPNNPVINITKRCKRRCPPTMDVNDGLDDFKNEIKNMLQSMIGSQNTRMDQLENLILEVKQINNNIQGTNTGIEKTMSSISDQITSLELKITGLEKERSLVHSKLAELEEKLESFDRSMVKTSVELRNVPKRPNETKEMLYSSVLELLKQLELNIQLSDIRDVLRQPSKKQNANSAITIEFTNTLVKSIFLAAVKAYNKNHTNNKLSSASLGMVPNTPVYIAEQLTVTSKRLFYQARNYAKANNIQYCWTSSGRIMLKKDPESQSIVIKSERQLEQLHPKDNNA